MFGLGGVPDGNTRFWRRGDGLFQQQGIALGNGLHRRIVVEPVLGTDHAEVRDFSLGQQLVIGGKAILMGNMIEISHILPGFCAWLGDANQLITTVAIGVFSIPLAPMACADQNISQLLFHEKHSCRLFWIRVS